MGGAMGITDFHDRDATEDQVTEQFDSEVTVVNSATFGAFNQLKFSLDGTGAGFVIPGDGVCQQTSPSYTDSGIIRSTGRLPKTYVISAIVGEIQYGLEKLDGVDDDPAYSEGPNNENGLYFLTVTDTVPAVPNINLWWHDHRKVVLDVDNNIWGWGMPNPVFMVYWDLTNTLNSYQENETWTTEWQNCYHYSTGSALYYRAQIERTPQHFIMSLFTEGGSLLISGAQLLSNVWHNDNSVYPEYMALGDPHENYYQGYAKFKSITVPVTTGYGTSFVGPHSGAA
jgi:hypothetical protein